MGVRDGCSSFFMCGWARFLLWWVVIICGWLEWVLLITGRLLWVVCHSALLYMRIAFFMLLHGSDSQGGPWLVVVVVATQAVCIMWVLRALAGVQERGMSKNRPLACSHDTPTGPPTCWVPPYVLPAIPPNQVRSSQPTSLWRGEGMCGQMAAVGSELGDGW